MSDSLLSLIDEPWLNRQAMQEAVEGLNRTKIFELLRDKQIPAPRRLTKRTLAWPRALMKEYRRQLMLHGDWDIARIEHPELKALAVKLAADYWGKGANGGS